MPKKILIIEDHPDIVDLIEMFFSHRGYVVSKQTTGNGALSAAASELPHVIILDIVLPGTDGFHVAAQLRQNPQTRRIPILAVTGSTWDESELRSAKVFDAFLRKPFELKQLERKVQQLMDSTRIPEKSCSHE